MNYDNVSYDNTNRRITDVLRTTYDMSHTSGMQTAFGGLGFSRFDLLSDTPRQMRRHRSQFWGHVIKVEHKMGDLTEQISWLRSQRNLSFRNASNQEKAVAITFLARLHPEVNCTNL